MCDTNSSLTQHTLVDVSIDVEDTLRRSRCRITIVCDAREVQLVQDSLAYAAQKMLERVDGTLVEAARSTPG